eukprot:RCo043727
MFRRIFPVFQAADNAKFVTLLNLVCGKQSLKDHLPVKDASLARIFGDSWKSELQAWYSQNASSLGSEAVPQATLDMYLKRIELTRYTRAELTDFGILAQGPAAVQARAEQCMLQLAAARLEELVASYGAEGGKEAFKNEVQREAKLANWSSSDCENFLAKVVA